VCTSNVCKINLQGITYFSLTEVVGSELVHTKSIQWHRACEELMCAVCLCSQISYVALFAAPVTDDMTWHTESKCWHFISR